MKSVVLSPPSPLGVIGLAQSLAVEPDLVPFLKFGDNPNDGFVTQPISRFWDNFDAVFEGLEGRGVLSAFEGAGKITFLGQPLDQDRFSECQEKLRSLLLGKEPLGVVVVCCRHSEMDYHRELKREFPDRFKVVFDSDPGKLCLGSPNEVVQRWLREAHGQGISTAVEALKVAVRARGEKQLCLESFARRLAALLLDSAGPVEMGAMETEADLLSIFRVELCSPNPLSSKEKLASTIRRLPEVVLNGIMLVLAKSIDNEASYFAAHLPPKHLGVWFCPGSHYLCVDFEKVALPNFFEGKRGWAVDRPRKFATFTATDEAAAARELGALLRHQLNWKPLVAVEAPEPLEPAVRAKVREWKTGLVVGPSNDESKVYLQFQGQPEKSKLRVVRDRGAFLTKDECGIDGDLTALATALAVCGSLDLAGIYPLVVSLIRLRETCASLKLFAEDGLVGDKNAHDKWNEVRSSSEALAALIENLEECLQGIDLEGLWARESRAGVESKDHSLKANLDILRQSHAHGQRPSAFQKVSECTRFILAEELNLLLEELRTKTKTKTFLHRLNVLTDKPSPFYGQTQEFREGRTVFSLGWLRLLVKELIRNACKYAWEDDSGFPLIWFHTKGGDDWTILEIADNGKGLSATKAKELYSKQFINLPFVEAHQARVRITSGTTTHLEDGWRWSTLPSAWTEPAPVTVPFSVVDAGASSIDASALTQHSVLSVKENGDADKGIHQVSESLWFGKRKCIGREGAHCTELPGNSLKMWGPGTRLTLLFKRIPVEC